MPPRIKPVLGKLAQYRLALPDRPSQGWVADKVSELTGEDVSQQAVGYWETGKVNLQNVHPRRLRAYASVLRISLDQLAETANLSARDLFSETALENDQLTTEVGGSARKATPAPALQLSDTLRAFIDEYSAKFKELLEPRWQRWLANTDFRDEPETPEDWLTVFLYFREKVNPR